jgi:pSer/pThr/pTyr-binding forkhead associated (FHA) protein
MTTGPSASASIPDLVVRVGSQSHPLSADGGVAVIGRDPSATVRVNDGRISRSHVRLEPRQDGWQVIDTSTNGMFVDGVRRNSALITSPMTLHLGDADGIPVTLVPGGPRDETVRTAVEETDATEEAEDSDNWDELSETDPDVARAGRAVATRRRELDITQRSLARDKVINAGTLIAFEKGRSWPRRGTLAKLEEVLSWPAGTITRIRNGSPADPDSEVTEVLTDTVQAPLMAEAVEIALHNIGPSVSALPDPSEPEFTQRATPLLANLRQLETVAANAARNARGTPSVALALSAVRRCYNDLMLRAAKSPSATLGQRVYGARHSAELSVEEAANAAGVSTQTLLDAESERSVPPDAVEAISTLIAQLAMS